MSKTQYFSNKVVDKNVYFNQSIPEKFLDSMTLKYKLEKKDLLPFLKYKKPAKMIHRAATAMGRRLNKAQKEQYFSNLS